MKTKSIILLALLFGTLTVTGCGLFFHHCGPRHCKPGCESATGQPPCPQNENCVKAAGHKPCCEKMKAAETPAQ